MKDPIVVQIRDYDGIGDEVRHLSDVLTTNPKRDVDFVALAAHVDELAHRVRKNHPNRVITVAGRVHGFVRLLITRTK